MTAAADEQAQTGPAGFRDVVDVQVFDESLLVAARIARAPSEGSASMTAVVVEDDEPVLAIAEARGRPSRAGTARSRDRSSSASSSRWSGGRWRSTRRRSS